MGKVSVGDGVGCAVGTVRGCFRASSLLQGAAVWATRELLRSFDHECPAVAYLGLPLHPLIVSHPNHGGVKIAVKELGIYARESQVPGIAK
jgi:hypothetical protein